MNDSLVTPGAAKAAGRPRTRPMFPFTWFKLTALVVAVAACERENRRFDDSPPKAGEPRLSALQPGPTMSVVMSDEGLYDDNAWAANEGKRLFAWMNCSGCHANGGGGMGPALMDDVWIYGHQPEQIYYTIVEGRPNGMPSFRDRLTTQQVWQLVAYVRSLSGLLPRNVRPSRDDHMMTKPAEAQTPRATPRQSTKVPLPPPPNE